MTTRSESRESNVTRYRRIIQLLDWSKPITSSEMTLIVDESERLIAEMRGPYTRYKIEHDDIRGTITVFTGDGPTFAINWKPSGWLVQPWKCDGAGEDTHRQMVARSLRFFRLLGPRIAATYRHQTRRSYYRACVLRFAENQGRDVSFNPYTSVTREAKEDAQKFRDKLGNWKSVAKIFAKRNGRHSDGLIPA